MRILTKFVATLVLVLLSVSTFAVPVKLVSTAGAIPVNGVLSGFYQLEVDGVPTVALCDDYNTRVSVGQTWQANILGYDDIVAGEGKFSPAVKYGQSAFLLHETEGESASTVAAIQNAIWKVMDPSVGLFSALATSYYATATSGAYDSFDWRGRMAVITPDPLSASQEFLVKLVPVPAPGTLPLLFLGVMALGLWRHKLS